MATMIKKYKELNMDITKTLIDAIIASGKKINDIPKKTIFEYLDRSGINKSKWEEVYQALYNKLENKEDSKVKFGDLVEDRRPKNIIDYTAVSHTNDLIKRVPRKNIFSEIIKIT
jgi:Cdc6-like AAA superfamily ATPase